MLQGNPQQADLAYVAGNFDGEGSFVAYFTPSQKHFKAVITSTYLPTLEWYQELFGGSIHKSGGYAGELGKKQCYNWHLTGQRAYAFIQQTLPYLREKQEHASFMLTIWEQRADSETFKRLAAERKARWGRAAAETK